MNLIRVGERKYKLTIYYYKYRQLWYNYCIKMLIRGNNMRYSSNYLSKGNNYRIILQSHNKKNIKTNIYGSFCVVQNIIQRGNPTKISNYLKVELGDELKNIKTNDNIKYLAKEIPHWKNLIKGSDELNYYPAREFLYKVIPKHLQEFEFIQKLILPEVKISDIIETENKEFVDQQVDFYLPQCNLVIEIDGSQHTREVNRQIDIERDGYLAENGIKTIRFTSNIIRKLSEDKSDDKNIRELYSILKNSDEIKKYRNEMFVNSKIARKYDGIMRFQNLILEQLKEGIISLNDNEWIFNIKDDGDGIPFKVAITDIFLYLKHILNLQGKMITFPTLTINKVHQFNKNNKGVNVDISVTKRWDYSLDNPKVSYVRADYMDNRNYFKVAVSEAMIKYKIEQSGKEKNVDSLCYILDNIYGFNKFNDGQLGVIKNALELQDTIGLLPTGAGKSLCYQLVCLLQPTINFVVVPIKSLMYDQKINLDSKGIVHTNYISGDLSAEEKHKIMKDLGNGKYFYVWVSPERFQTEDFRHELSKINSESLVGYAVIDEVHCLSEWGHDFRTSYLHLSKTIRNHCPGALFLGLSATASTNVLKDILAEFEISKENVKTILDYTRKELTFKVYRDTNGNRGDKFNRLNELLDILNKKRNVFELDGEESKCGIIFTPYVKGPFGCYGLYNKLNENDNYKGKVGYYSGEVPKKDVKGDNKYTKQEPIMAEKQFNKYKKEVQDKFKNNQIPLLIATKAFGMGVDKPNVRYTIHYGIPASIESLYQEGGRAGRDRKNAACYIINSVDKMDKEDHDKIFGMYTTVEEMQEILEKYNWSKGDILRILYLSLSGHRGIDEESQLAYHILNVLSSKKSRIISVTDIKNSINTIGINGKEIKVDFNTVQKAIYRLSLLGLINDWIIRDWGNKGKFDVDFRTISNTEVRNNLIKYIRKYEPEFHLDRVKEGRDKNIREILDSEGNEIYKYIKIIIQWNYDNVFYSRRESLKNVEDLCLDYEEKGAEFFKNKLEGYFKVTDSTFIISSLGDNPTSVEDWYKILLKKDGHLISPKEISEVNNSMLRFIEGARFNSAYNYLYSITSLCLSKFHLKEVRDRLEEAFNNIDDYSLEKKEIIFKNSLIIGKNMVPESKEILSQVLNEHFTDKIRIYKELEDNNSLSLILSEGLDKLEKVGGALNGKCRQAK